MTVAANDGDLDEFQDDNQNDDEAHLGNEQPDDEVDLDPDAPDAELEDDEGVVVTIDGESPPPNEDAQNAPEWVREVRKASREKDKLIREKDKRIQELEQKSPAPTVTLGPKPTLESCDYDSEALDTQLDAWYQRKQAVDVEQRKAKEQQAEQQRQWNARLANHAKLAADLKVPDFEDATAPLESVMSETQRAMIVYAADNSAVLLYALGKNPSKAKELASIADPTKFAFAVAKLEMKLKVTPRKAAPIPERTVRGNASVSGSVDPKLARLEDEAEKSGDRTKVVAYKRELSKRKQAA